MDRKLMATLWQPVDFTSTLLPLVYPSINGSLSSCQLTSLLPLVYPSINGSLSSCKKSLKCINVNNKVVLCDGGGWSPGVSKGEEVERAGGAAMILMNYEIDGFSTEAEPFVLPAAYVSHADGLRIIEYINSSRDPMATILLKGIVIGNPPAPIVLSLSSRGPNTAIPGILKLDIFGPGVNILAAWPYSTDNKAKSNLAFNMKSGTSMAYPHLSGVAPLLKSCPPEWSPSAIKSDIMTTADVLNLEGMPIIDHTNAPADLFIVGASRVNPAKAKNPGLVYHIPPDDYIPYICGLN